MHDTTALADLSSCDREPIHIPGAIQPHGVLFAVTQPDSIVLQVSDNVQLHIGQSVSDVLQRPVDAWLDPACTAAVRAALAGARQDEVEPLRVLANGKAFDALVHAHDDLALLELEPATQGDGEARRAQSALPRALRAVARAQTLEELCSTTAREIKRITGFDRVVVYRFDEEGHGSVLAEEKEAGLEAYLGLRYPASDIPQQARALYLKNWLRIIPDARYVPVPIVPNLCPATGRPLDLSFSVLRSVSPVHLEYLANLGVRASMSVSLIVHNKLWGLVSCGHHTGPRFLQFELRSTVEALGRVVSLQLGAFADRDAEQRRCERRPTQQKLAATMSRVSHNEDVLALLLGDGRDLLSLVAADGAAIVVGDQPHTMGRCPSPALIREIVRVLDERRELSPFGTDMLAELVPAAAVEKDVACGLLTFGLPGTPRRRLMWFRPEVISTVDWSGDPNKPVVADGTMRIHPRRSFELWKEEVRLRAQPWTSSDFEAAEELRRNAVEVDLGCQVSREQRAVRARDDLVAVVSHDLRSPLGVIQMQAAQLLRTVGSGAESEPSRRLRAGAERIQRAVDRMNSLVSDLLDLARIEAGRFQLRCEAQQVDDLVQDALTIVRPLADRKHIQIAEQVANARVRADRERVFQVLSNLLSNAIKFTPEGGGIVMRTRANEREVLFTVADTGPGIPGEQLPHVFERYWQARRAGQEGTGLGLYIAKGIVEAHGGRIWAESPPGSGARLHFTLPAGARE